eukprot:ANDGO_03098.mRNA.1 hypothetical protein SPRG_03265
MKPLPKQDIQDVIIRLLNEPERMCQVDSFVALQRQLKQDDMLRTQSLGVIPAIDECQWRFGEFLKAQIVESARQLQAPLGRLRTEASESKRIIREATIGEDPEEAAEIVKLDFEGLDIYLEDSSDSDREDVVEHTAPPASFVSRSSGSTVPSARTSSSPSSISSLLPAPPPPASQALSQSSSSTQSQSQSVQPAWRPIYTWKVLYEVLCRLSSPNRDPRFLSVSSIRLELPVPDTLSLQQMFQDLSLEKRHIGVDDMFPENLWYVEARTKSAERIVRDWSFQAAREYLRCGSPASCRPALWRLVTSSLDSSFSSTVRTERSLTALFQNNSSRRSVYSSASFSRGAKQSPFSLGSANGSSFSGPASSLLGEVISATQTGSERSVSYCSDGEVAYFENLQAQVEKVELFTDALYRMDVQSVMNSDMFFVFDDVCQEMMLAFSRDPWVAKNSQAAWPPLSPVSSSESSPCQTAYPPCNVIPFSSIAYYASPLFYLFADNRDIYFVFRLMYSRYFCHLHVISAHPQSIVSLSRLFEVLVQHRAPQVFVHLNSLGIPPLEIAFRWIVHAFADVLDIDQLFLLWDRILGFDSLYVIPVLAAAIFAFRSKPLLAAQCVEDVRDIMRDNSRIRVVSLLQQFLFDPELS